jgi:RimJ/RimL family protein N-acetyltransferase
MARAAVEFGDDLLAIIHPDNRPSRNVCQKLGFRYWKTAGLIAESHDHAYMSAHQFSTDNAREVFHRLGPGGSSWNHCRPG